MSNKDIVGPIDKYIITFTPPIGQGGFGTVHKGVNSETGVKIAAKQIVFKGNKRRRKLVEKEMELTKQIPDHKHIVKAYGHYLTSDLGWIFLEYCNLGDLDAYLKKSVRLDIKSKVKIMYQSASAVQFMHSLDPQIIHRDIKPENILLKREKGDIIVKFSDFGLSRLYYDGSKMTTYCGTRHYMAPELHSDFPRYESSVDIFSLGLVILVVLQSEIYSDLLPLSGNRHSPLMSYLFLYCCEFMLSIVQQMIFLQKK